MLTATCESDRAFERAIQAGVLSLDAGAPNYAGWFMWMGAYGAVDHFKHRDTKDYLTNPPTTPAEREEIRDNYLATKVLPHFLPPEASW